MLKLKWTAGLWVLWFSLINTALALEGPPPEVWQSYHDYQRLSDELDQLTAAFPNLMTKESIGQSVEGRQIWLVTITNGNLPNDGKTKVYFDGAMHGSEVIGSESMLYYIRFLVQQYDSDPNAHEIVDGWITYVVPMINPDGVEGGKNSDDYRNARKNHDRVDLNRNFDWHWPPDCRPGCSEPCMPTCFQYPGPSTFSEPESQITRDQLLAKQPLLYLSAHAGLSFPQLIRPGEFDTAEEEQRHTDIQDCIRSFTPFRKTSGDQGGAAKNWTYGVAMRDQRDSGLFPLAFNLEIYSISGIAPGGGNHYWWCRYNPPVALDDSVAQWCIDGTGYPPDDTLVSRMEKFKTAVVYITQSTTGLRECPAATLPSLLAFTDQDADGCSSSQTFGWEANFDLASGLTPVMFWQVGL